jgi:hypothetical protein
VSRRDGYREELCGLPPARWPGYLTEHSGLPGPRANIELGQAVADAGEPATFDELLATGDEYLVFCGVLGLGRLLAEGAAVPDRLRGYAIDSRWRVREAVAMALQRLGDADITRLLDVVAVWAVDPDPLVQRAAVAGICEPRLLRTPVVAVRAVDACAAATRTLVARPANERRTDGVRALRKALGYCWSVAVAADRTTGWPRFLALQNSSDPDAAWIFTENSRKARLAGPR